jgi:hypothetical protein
MRPSLPQYRHLSGGGFHTRPASGHAATWKAPPSPLRALRWNQYEEKPVLELGGIRAPYGKGFRNKSAAARTGGYCDIARWDVLGPVRRCGRRVNLRFMSWTIESSSMSVL